MRRPAPDMNSADAETSPALDVFVPSPPEERAATAAFLVESANDNGISQRHIQFANRGFYISDALADVVYADDTETPDPADAGPGNTGSTDSTEGE